MNKTANISFCLIILAFLASCTSGRWVVKDRQAVDQSDYEVLEQRRFLEAADSLSPENPVLTLDLKSHTSYRYKQKMLVQRSIQDYRLRPGFIALGLAGAAASFYAANASRFDSGTGQSLALNAVGVLLAASGFLNLKPAGDPRPVGEERYLEETGSVVKTDTVSIKKDDPAPATVLVSYRGETVFKEELEQIPKGRLQIPLAQAFNDLLLTDNDPGAFEVKVEYRDSTYSYNYPVSSVLEPFARITAELTELRSKPSLNPGNVLADLARGSQIKVDTIMNDQWYRVWYGISQNFIQRKDALLIWRSINFSADDKVVAVPRLPFGNIDVESNIPVLREAAPNARALIITNENYSDSLSDRQHTHRDGKLMEAYLERALGYASKNIHHLTDIDQPNQIFRQIEKISAASNDSTELFVYIGGYGESRDTRELYLKSVPPPGEESGKGISLESIFNRIGSLPSAKNWVVLDIDFSRSMSDNLPEAERESLVRSHASALTQSAGTVIMMSSLPGQTSRLYRSSAGEDKKHHIFPYFFARALQQQRTSAAEIYNLLDRNISYTSRRLHDRPQQPLIFGERSLSFTGP